MAHKMIGLTLISLFVFSCQSTGVRKPSSAFQIKAGHILNCSSENYSYIFGEDLVTGQSQTIKMRPPNEEVQLMLNFTPYKGVSMAHVEMRNCPGEGNCGITNTYFDPSKISAEGQVEVVYDDYYEWEKKKNRTVKNVRCSIKAPNTKN